MAIMPRTMPRTCRCHYVRNDFWCVCSV